MEKFTSFTGVICAVDRANIDTDALIPKEHLKSIKRTGFGPALFSDWRYHDDGTDNPEFALNQPKAAGASILVGATTLGAGRAASMPSGRWRNRALKSSSPPRRRNPGLCRYF